MTVSAVWALRVRPSPTLVANGMRMDTSGVAKNAQLRASFSCARGLRARKDGTMNSHHIQKPRTYNTRKG